VFCMSETNKGVTDDHLFRLHVVVYNDHLQLHVVVYSGRSFNLDCGVCGPSFVARA